jgi:hypothetical protein
MYAYSISQAENQERKVNIRMFQQRCRGVRKAGVPCFQARNPPDKLLANRTAWLTGN